MEKHALDIAVLAAYMGLTLAVGIWFALRKQDADRFMSAGRSLPAWAVGLSIFGSFVSGISFLGIPGTAFEKNWLMYAFAISLPPAAWVAARWFVRFYRAAGEVSSYEHLEGRFGVWARTYAVVCYVLIQIARSAINIYLISLPISALLGWEVRWVCMCVGILMTLFPLVGGTEAVVWLGVAQSGILAFGLMLCVGTLLFGMPEGPGQIFRIAQAHHKFSFESAGTGLAGATVWLVATRGLFVNLQNFGIDQTYVQRYITAKSDTAARRSVWLGAMLYIPISAGLFFVGTALFAYYRARPDLFAAGLSADQVFPHFIKTRLPVGLRGLVVAAICAAATDSNYNCTSTLLLKDVYQRYFRPLATEKESMWVLRFSTMVCGGIATIVGLKLIGVRSALGVWWKLEGTFGGGMLGLFLLGRVFKRVGGPAAAAGVAAGILVIAWMSFSPMLASREAVQRMWPVWATSPFHDYWIPIIGTSTILCVGGLAGLLFPARKPAGQGV